MKKHSDIPRKEFLYQNCAKKEGLGKFANFKGFQCNLCDRVVKNLRSHLTAVHKDETINERTLAKMLDEGELISNKNSLKYVIDSYGRALQKSGVYKRNVVTKGVAKTYCRQVTKLLPSIRCVRQPQMVHENLQSISTFGEASTKYSYLATLLNFLKFVDLNFPEFERKAICTLIKHVKNWLLRQRQKKGQRESFVKETSRQKPKGSTFPLEAIRLYEEISKEEIEKLVKVNPGCLKKDSIEKLYGDIFFKTVCKNGCRPSVLRGMIHKELEQAEKTTKGFYSILVKDQKEKRRPACVLFNEIDFEHLKLISLQARKFLKVEYSKEYPVFPSLINGKKMKGTEFDRIYRKRSAIVYSSKVTATDIRKLITTKMRNQSKDVQEAVARSEGHSIAIAEKHYNMAPSWELVEKARIIMEDIAKGNLIHLNQLSMLCNNFFIIFLS